MGESGIFRFPGGLSQVEEAPAHPKTARFSRGPRGARQAALFRYIKSMEDNRSIGGAGEDGSKRGEEAMS